MNTLSKTFIALILMPVLSGCVSTPFIEITNEAADQIDNPPLPTVYIQSLPAEDREIAREVVAAVQSVLLSGGEFEKALSGLTLKKHCGQDADVTGAEVYSDLTTNISGFSLMKQWYWTAKAKTDITAKRVKIIPKRYKGWHKGIEKQADMVNTFTHELTHLVPQKGTADKFKYRDTGRKNKCLRSSLVSYSVGELAREIWLKNQKYVEAKE